MRDGSRQALPAEAHLSHCSPEPGGDVIGVVALAGLLLAGHWAALEGPPYGER
jgi:hypothetical protein